MYKLHKPVFYSQNPPQKTYQMFETTHSLKQNETFLQSGESKSD